MTQQTSNRLTPKPSPTPSKAPDGGGNKPRVGGNVEDAMRALAPRVKRSADTVEAGALEFLRTKLAVDGKLTRRSDELKAYHGSIQSAAKATAAKNAKTAASGHSEELQNDAEVRSEDAGKEAAKGFLEDLAKRGAADAVTTIGVTPALEEAAKGASSSGDAAVEKALAAKAKTLAKPVEAFAATWAKTHVKQHAQSDAADLTQQMEEQEVGAEAADASLTHRQAVNGAVNAAYPAVIQLIKDKLGAYVEKQIGARSTSWFAKPEVKQFRAQMKRSGRRVAYQQVDQAIADDTTSGAATKQYMEVAAKDVAYSKAKVPVNEALVALAADTADQAVDESDAKGILRKAGRAEGYSAFRKSEDRTDIDKVVAKAVQAAKGAAQLDAQGKASTLIAGIVSGAEKADAEERVTDQVDQSSVGQESLTAALSASTTDEGMSKIGSLIDSAVPKPGDSCEVSVELDIPIPNSPAFILLRFGGSAERGDGQALEIGAEFHVGAGANILGIKADGSLGFFVRAGAADTRKTMQVLNYGAYRSACKIHDALGDWWGGSGKSEDVSQGGHGKSATERAEMWAAMIEERCFMGDPDAFVELGGALTGRASVKFTDKIGLEAEARAELFTRYDKGIIERAMTAINTKEGRAPADELAMGKAMGDTEADAKARRAGIKGETGGGISLSCSGSFGIGKGLSAGVGLSVDLGSNGWEIEATGSLGSSSELEDGKTKLEPGQKAMSFAESVVGMIKTLTGKSTGKDSTAKRVGMFGQLIGNGESFLNAATGKLSTAIGEAHQLKNTAADVARNTDASEVGGKLLEKGAAFATETEFELVLTAGGKFETGAGLETLLVKLNQVTTRKVALGVSGGANYGEASLTTSKNLFKAGLEDGEGTFSVLGHKPGQGTQQGTQPQNTNP